MVRVLVAEDDTAVRTFVTRALAHRGYETVAVEDGIQALEALASQEFDLLLTDISMPVMDGISLALKLARDQPNLPILMMTGYTAERQRAHNLDEIICGILVKPFTLKRVCDAVDGALGLVEAD